MTMPINDGFQRDVKGRFIKGNKMHGLGSGRPKGNIEAKAREATANGQELIDFWLGVLRSPNEEMTHRLKASEHIASWGFVKPKEGTEHDISDRLFDILARVANAK